MKQPREVFLEFLRRRGLNMTPQRAAIVETFLESEGHFSSEQLCVKARRLDPAIGQATVYRTLKLLVESGLAGALQAGDGPTLYEHSYGHAHHDHMVCLHCGDKLEIVDEEIEQRQVELARVQGFSLTSHSMVLFGYCAACQNTGKA